MAFSEQFIAEMLEKHDIDDAVFLVDGAPCCTVLSIVTAANGDTKHTASGTP